MKSELSILIPTFNDYCLPIVMALSQQAELISGLKYEIIVADDGSTDSAIIEANRPIADLPNTKLILREKNCGRAAIRNFLALESQYSKLLFVDCDMTIVRSDFISKYLDMINTSAVVYGGYIVGQGLCSCLRYIYEKKAEPHHTTEQRKLNPYSDFHTSNFMIDRDIMLRIPFDEKFHKYGYEDVLFGKHLQENGVEILHIDNPVGFCTFEDNSHFVAKTEEGLQTLKEFNKELQGYNGLLDLTQKKHFFLMKGIILLWHKLFGKLERYNLCGKTPSLFIFKLYKLGYYLSLPNVRKV